MRKPNKKKRFKLIKVKRKPEPKKERPHAQALIDMFIDKGFDKEMAKVAAFALMVRHKEACLPAMKFPQGGIISDVVISGNREFVINPNRTFKVTDLNTKPISAPLKDALALIAEKIKADLVNQGHK